MEKRRRAIKGAQVNPPVSNNVQPECIKVCKVYDWTILSSEGWQGITIASGLGNECVLAIDAALEDPTQEVTVQCTVEASPQPRFRRCGVVEAQDACGLCSASVIRQGVTVGGSSQAAVVKLIQAIPVTLQVLVNGQPLAACPPVTSTVMISENTVLCLPAPLTSENISCRVFDVRCDASCIMEQGEARVVNVDVSLCKDVRVETEVVLEVAAKFCQPRLPIAPPSTTCSIDVPFPPQCPSFFPEPNCTCQANINTSSVGITAIVNETTTIGRGSLTASICPNCILDQSSLSYSFVEDTSYIPTDDGFSFVANQGSFTQPACTFDAGTSTLTTSAVGTVSTANGEVIPNVNVSLTVIQGIGTCMYSITFSNLAGTFSASSSVSTMQDVNLCNGINIQDCVTLPEFGA